MLGHGSQEMTFLCYVHTLDLLLFAAADRTHTYGDRQLQRAAVGISEPDRHNPVSGTDLLRFLPKVFRRRALFHERDQSSDAARSATSAQAFDLTRLTTLHGSLALRQASGSAAKDDVEAKLLSLPAPGTAAQRLAAVAAVTTLNLALAADGVGAQKAIRLWSQRKLAREEWATMDGAQLNKFLDGICCGELDTGCLEILQIRGVPGTKRKMVSELGGNQLRSVRAAGAADGRYWVRLRDQRAATVRRKLDSTGRKRQSTQKAVSWVLLAAAVELSRMPATDLTDSAIPS